MVVDGRTVSYACGGHGLPVLFLHGWGLDHESYRRALRRLTARGCHVIAPSLPGFGRSDELPVLQRTLVGYAGWVERFLQAIGVDEPVVVLGHSFGGGIATRFAHDRPDRVRYLVMLNAVGDAQSFAAGGLAGRAERIGLDGVRSLFDALRPTDDLATIGQMQRTLLANLRRHPFTVLQAAHAALTADLRTEMAVLAARGLPVLILWSDGDRLIPLAAFDTFCSTFGTDGHVVRGGHSWLLANPDVFGEVLDNVIHVEGRAHGARAATTSVDEVRRLLATTSAAADDGAPAARRRVAAVGAERGPGRAGRRPRPVPSPGPPRRGSCRRPPAAGRRPVPADGGRPGPSRLPGRHHRGPGDRRRVRGTARR